MKDSYSRERENGAVSLDIARRGLAMLPSIASEEETRSGEHGWMVSVEGPACPVYSLDSPRILEAVRTLAYGWEALPEVAGNPGHEWRPTAAAIDARQWMMGGADRLSDRACRGVVLAALYGARGMTHLI